MSDDDCRAAVGRLNTFRLMRAENLGDGYDVSDILRYEINASPNVTNAVS